MLGAEASRRYKKVNPRAEPLICASSLFATAPCLYLALILASRTLLASYVSEVPSGSGWEPLEDTQVHTVSLWYLHWPLLPDYLSSSISQ